MIKAGVLVAATWLRAGHGIGEGAEENTRTYEKLGSKRVRNGTRSSKARVLGQITQNRPVVFSMAWAVQPVNDRPDDGHAKLTPQMEFVLTVRGRWTSEFYQEGVDMERRPNLFLFVVVISGCLLVFLLSALQFTLLNNPTSFLKNLTISQIFPQGWGFYSISPREQQISLYDENGNLAVNWPNASLDNLFGLMRKGRAQGLEVGIVFAQLQENDFTRTEGNLKEAIKRYQEEIFTVKNPTPNAMIRGKYFLVKYQIVPWNWARFTKQEDAPAEIAEVNVVD